MAGNNYTAGLGFAQGFGSLVNGYNQSEAYKMQGEYQKRQADFNAKLAEMRARDAIKRGAQEVARLKSVGKRTVGAQRTAMAAQGIAIDSGSALEIQEDTETQVAMDAIKIKNNAWRESWGYKIEASNLSFSGAAALGAAQNSAANSLLAGGLSAMGSFAQGYRDLETSPPPKVEVGEATLSTWNQSRFGSRSVIG